MAAIQTSAVLPVIDSHLPYDNAASMRYPQFGSPTDEVKGGAVIMGYMDEGGVFASGDGLSKNAPVRVVGTAIANASVFHGKLAVQVLGPAVIPAGGPAPLGEPVFAMFSQQYAEIARVPEEKKRRLTSSNARRGVVAPTIVTGDIAPRFSADPCCYPTLEENQTWSQAIEDKKTARPGSVAYTELLDAVDDFYQLQVGTTYRNSVATNKLFALLNR